VTLTFSADAVVVVAGLPGAGKSTLIRHAVDRRAATVVDTDDQRAAGRRRLLNPVHYARIAAAIARRRPVVIHSRGTHAGARRAIALLARLSRRPAHLILLDVGRSEAEAGQQARGRTIGRAEMERQVDRWQRLTPRALAREGWASVAILDRAQAARTRAIEFTASTWPIGQGRSRRWPVRSLRWPRSWTTVLAVRGGGSAPTVTSFVICSRRSPAASSSPRSSASRF
jgi:predicted kinase